MVKIGMIVHILESLRQPIEDGVVTISRAAGTITYPAKFVLIAASNPCPCGYLGDPVKKCRCLPGHILMYKKRISGPIIDRIDLHIDLPPVQIDKLSDSSISESSALVQRRVQKARDLQTKRYRNTNLVCNSDLTSKSIKKYIQLSKECVTLLDKAVSTMHLSARTYFRVIKVSRTIADLNEEQEISTSHVAEALQYRPKDDN